MSTIKTTTLSNLAGTSTVPVDTVVQGSELREFIEYRDGKLFWIKKPSQPVKIGSDVGCVTKDYYRFKFRGHTYANHRVIFFLHHNWFPEEVDHINGNKLDNRIENLRSANKSCNQANSPAYNGRSVKGAYKLPSGRFMALIQKNGCREYLGVFNTEQEAGDAYWSRAIILHGEFARKENFNVTA